MGGRAKRVTAAVLVFAGALLLAILPALLPGAAPLPLLAGSEAFASPGVGWVKQSLVATDYALSDAVATDQNTVWCVGPYLNSPGGLVLKTTDGGAHWQRHELDTGEINKPVAIDAVDGNTAWAVGTGTILKTTDGGSHWSPQGAVQSIWLTGISAVSGQVAWAAGIEATTSFPPSFRGVVLRTTDGGDTWTTVKSGADNVQYFDIDAVDGNTAWVSAQGGVLATTDGGASWTSHAVSGAGQLRKISCLAGGKVWALGNADTESAMSVFISNDAGSSWARYDFPIDYTSMITIGLSVADGNNAWVAATRNEPIGMYNIEGYVFRTADGGVSWERLYPCNDVFPLAVCTAGANTAWVAGMGSIAKTTDGGATWVSQLPLDCDFYDVDARSGSGVIAVGSRGMSVNYAHMFNPALSEGLWLGGPLLVPDGGQLNKDLRGVAVEQDFYWAVGVDGTVIKYPTPQSEGVPDDQSLGIPNDGYAVSSADAVTAWIAGENGIMKTSDGGNNWVAQVVIPQTVYAVHAVDTQTVYAAGQGGLLGKTTDGGAHWAAQSSGVTVDLYGITAANAQTAWAVGAGGTILKTTDGGAHWTPQASGVSADLYDVTAVDAFNAWAVGAGGTILRTYDGGAHWAAQSSGVSVALRGVAALDADNAFAVGDDGTILRTEDGGGPAPQLTVTSVTPKQATQLTYRINLTVTGSGFQPGAAVRLEKGATVIKCFNAKVVSGTQITCSADVLGASPGAYDVVVANPGGGEARLCGGFTITSACGTGSGTAVLALGLALGMLSLGGILRTRRRKG